MARVPEPIRQRFIAQRNVYYFLGGGRAFIDHGDRLTTRSENKALIGSLVEIAQARGWRAITVSGTERFKNRLWLAARLAGLAVASYRADVPLRAQLERERARRARSAPAPAAQLELAELPARTRAPAASSPMDARPHATREWRGRLIEHGAAPYRHEPANGASYFVRLQTSNAEQLLWGVDLERALRASLSQPATGDEVVLRRVGQEAVSVRASVSGEGARTTYRHRYVIETQAFVEERARLARVVREASVSARIGAHRHPVLAPTYLKLRAAELVSHRLSHPEDQRSFVHRVRRAVADSIARGEPFGAVALRVRAREAQRESQERANAPFRE
jgi:putative DNA primase/helicase